MAQLTTVVALTPTETAVLWGLHHPYWLGAIALSLIILLQLSVSLLGQLLRRTLAWLSRSPLFVSRWLIAKTTIGETAAEQRIETILQRLDHLQAEQTALVAELKKQLPNRESV